MIKEIKENTTFHLFSNVFENGKGPSSLSEEQRYVVIKLDKTGVTKEEARKMIVQIIEIVVVVLTLRPPNDSPSGVERNENQPAKWLYSSELTEEPLPPQRVSGPILGSQPTALSTGTSNTVW